MVGLPGRLPEIVVEAFRIGLDHVGDRHPADSGANELLDEPPVVFQGRRLLVWTPGLKVAVAELVDRSGSSLGGRLLDRIGPPSTFPRRILALLLALAAPMRGNRPTVRPRSRAAESFGIPPFMGLGLPTWQKCL
jgi:hypothetical protein